MFITASTKFSSNDNLFFKDNFNHIKLYHTNDGLIGKFDVWHDSQNENREYIEFNDGKLYLDTINQE